MNALTSIVSHHPRRSLRATPALASIAIVCFLAACGDSPTGVGDGGGGGGNGGGGGDVDSPEISVSSSATTFSLHQGGPAPSPEAIGVTNGGSGTLSGLNAAVAYDQEPAAGWLTATLSGSTAPATLTLAATGTEMEVGSHGARVTVEAEGAEGGAAVIEVTLDVQQNAAPTIAMTSPSRAAMLEQGSFDSSDVQVTGEACHPTLPITALEVDGEAISVSGENLCETFDVVKSSGWGLSTVAVHAASFGRTADVVQSFLRSPEFLPVEPAAIANGIFTQWNQPAIDDRDPDFDDWAAFVHAGITASNVYAGLPSVLASESWDFLPCNPEIRLTKRSLGYAYSFSLRPTSYGMDTELVLTNPALGVRAQVLFSGSLCPATKTVDGTFRVTELAVNGLADAVMNGLNPQVTVDGVTVSSLNPGLELDTSGFVGAIAEWVVNTGINRLQARLEGAAAAFIVENLPDILAHLITSVTVDETFGINGRELVVESDVDSIQIGNGNARIGLATLVELVGSPAGPTPARGPIRADSDPPPPFSTTEYEAASAIDIDVINQLLWSAWRADAFDVEDLSAFAAGAGVQATGTVTPLLPPIIGPGSDGWTFEVAWGDLAVVAEVEMDLAGSFAVKGFATARLGVALGYDDVEHRLRVADVSSNVQVQIDGGNLPAALEEPITARLESVVDRIAGQLSAEALARTPRVVIDAGALENVPPGTIVGFENATVGRVGSWLTMTGTLVELP